MKDYKNFFSILRSVLIFTTATFCAISIFSYDVADSSLTSFSSVKDISNLLGTSGAIVADLIVQVCGIAGFVIPVAIILYHRVRYVYYATASMTSYTIGCLFFIYSISSAAESFTPEIAEKYMYGGLIGNFSTKLPAYDALAAFIMGMLVLFRPSSYIKAFARITNFAKRFLVLCGKKIETKSGVSRDPIRKKSIEKSSKRILKALKESKTKMKPNITVQTSNAAEDLRQNYVREYDQPVKIDTSFLVAGKDSESPQNLEESKAILPKLDSVLKDFKVQGKITNIQVGPVVTMYELEPSAGTKSSRVIGLSDDIARSMSAISARISVIPGRNAIGIELPNSIREIVRLREIIESNQYQNQNTILPLALGKTLNGTSFTVDLAKMPHLLVAGTTGSGKSVAINAMILSLLYKRSAEQCRMIMIDPKMLELSIYDGIPHLMCPVVTDPKKASTALKWVAREMENRYKTMSKVGVRNIEGYNSLIKDCINRNKIIEKKLQTGFDPETGAPIFETEQIELKTFHYIVVIVDEMADLMLVAGKEVEISIQRLAQMARAAGIHIIMATQRPSVDVITGVIKANFPTRISFAVTSKIDSRTILGEQGAEQLLGMGDMLYMAAGGKVTRVHGPFVDDSEVKKVVEFLKSQGEPKYLDGITIESEDNESSYENSDNENTDEEQELYESAKNIVFESNKTSTSYIQRQLRIGYNRAANLIERMEKEGILSEANRSGKREILRK